MHSSSPAGLVGLFLVLLGAGVILDADWIGLGAMLIAAGSWCFWSGHRRDARRPGAAA